MESLVQPQSNTPKLAVFAQIAVEACKRDPRTINQKLAHLKQKASSRFPNLGLDSYDIIKANDFMYAALNGSTKEIIIVFTGTNVPIVGIASCLVSALRFTRDIMEEYKKHKIILVGSGPGGAVAERVAYFTGNHCESFNAEPISANYDKLFHNLVNVKAHTIQPPKIIEPSEANNTTKKQNKQEDDSISLEMLDYNQLAKIKGVYLDEHSNACTFVVRTEGTSDLDIHASDLITALSIFYDPDSKTKTISFSLEPAEEDNPHGPQQMKVFWPDKVDGKKSLEGTELGEAFFNADWHMKQISMGAQVSDLNTGAVKEFVIPEKLKKLGLKANHDFGEYTVGEHNWSRLWLVIKEVKAKRLDKQKKKGVKYFDVEDIVMGVEARQMKVNEAGKLEDMVDQDPNHNSYKFAQRFTEIFNEIAKEYPVYQRLKQAAKAIVLAQWMWVNKVPIDYPNIKKIVEEEKKKMVIHRSLVPSLEHRFESDTRVVRVFGGVDMCISSKQLLESDTKPDYKFEESKTSQILPTLLHQVSLSKTIPNPFLKKAQCENCGCRLQLLELSNLHEGKFYCISHHPLYCWGCNDFIQDRCMKIGNNGTFHPECFTCARCDKQIEGQLGVIAETAYMHKDCIAVASKELLAAHVKDQGTSSQNSSGSLTAFEKKVDKVMKLNRRGDESSYKLIPYTAEDHKGYKLGKTGIDVTKEEKLLAVLKDLLEKTGMKDFEKVIAKIKSKKELTKEEIAHINEKLDSFGGKKVIDELYIRVLNSMTAHVNKVIESVTDAEIKTKLQKSEHAQLALIDYENRFKLDTRLLGFLSGAKVVLDAKNFVIIDKQADIAGEINRFVDKTKPAEKAENAKRSECIEKIVKEKLE